MTRLGALLVYSAIVIHSIVSLCAVGQPAPEATAAKERDQHRNILAAARKHKEQHLQKMKQQGAGHTGRRKQNYVQDKEQRRSEQRRRSQRLDKRQSKRKGRAQKHSL